MKKHLRIQESKFQESTSKSRFCTYSMVKGLLPGLPTLRVQRFPKRKLECPAHKKGCRMLGRQDKQISTISPQFSLQTAIKIVQLSEGD